MPHIHLADGTVHYLDAHSADLNTYNIETLAHHLALINRFTGATYRPYSVAEHSLLCADIAAARGLPVVAQLACLMHDAHEAITGDASTPVKWALGEPWERFEGPHARALRAHFGLRTVFSGYGRDIKLVDYIALATERRDLLGFDPERHAPWPQLDTPGQIVEPAAGSLNDYRRVGAAWSHWKSLFCHRFHDLRAQIQAADAQFIVAATGESRAA
ncbi:hypothetical protein [Alicycliphilus denitrificans]|uniref:hypothetical protein n=1 Tax=Alicycliphilus denitrificans TaxID=179636 RepID=UPI000C9F020F|nr:hypothetical protein [Alicycliphilus denitrificans]